MVAPTTEAYPDPPATPWQAVSVGAGASVDAHLAGRGGEEILEQAILAELSGSSLRQLQRLAIDRGTKAPEELDAEKLAMSPQQLRADLVQLLLPILCDDAKAGVSARRYAAAHHGAPHRRSDLVVEGVRDMSVVPRTAAVRSADIPKGTNSEACAWCENLLESDRVTASMGGQVGQRICSLRAGALMMGHIRTL